MQNGGRAAGSERRAASWSLGESLVGGGLVLACGLLLAGEAWGQSFAPTFTLLVEADAADLLVGGTVDLPLFARETISEPTEQERSVFGKYPVYTLGGAVESVGSYPMDIIAAPGLTIDRTQRGNAGREELFFWYDFEGAEVVPPVNNTPVGGVSDWRIGTLRVDLGPPTYTVVGDEVTSAATVLDLSFGTTVGPSFGGLNYRPVPSDPTSGSLALFTRTTQTVTAELGPGENPFTVIADAEVVRFERTGYRNDAFIRAVNGGEMILDALWLDSPGTIEALPGSVVRLEPNRRIQQFDEGNRQFTFDDTLTGGTWRAINGTLNVAPDGFALATNEGTIELAGASAMTDLFDDAASSPGNLSTDGSSLNNHGTLRLDDGVKLSVFDLTNRAEARLEVVGDAELELFTQFPLVVSNFGTVIGDGTIDGGLNSSGIVEIGEGAAGELMVTKDASFQAESVLSIDWFGAGQADLLDVGGRLFVEDIEGIEAVLQLSLGAGFLPEIGDEVVIAQVGGELAGTFAKVEDNAAERDFVTIANTTAGTLSLRAVAAAAMPGDYNADGFVNLADYTVWRDNLGADAGTLVNDPNTGPIGQAQYATWKSNFGTALPPFAALAAETVPEPSTCVLLTMFALAITGRCQMLRHRGGRTSLLC